MTTHEQITESVAYERGINKYKIDFSRQDIIESHVNEWVLDWVKKYHPEAFKKARDFVEQNIDEENTE